MGRVIYKAGKTIAVSDKELLALLEKISEVLGLTVEVTSGDRESVPKGGSKTSDHLAHKAADIHVVGISDSTAFSKLRTKRSEIFGASQMAYQVIHHGSHTQTQGGHIHIGHNSDRNKAGFWTEGLTKEGKGRYSRVGMP